MKTAFIIHGVGGNSGENWFPWLKEELEKEGWNVIAPNFPTPKNQSLENWKKAFSEYKDLVNEETIFVAHSLGPSFVLSLLEDMQLLISACYLVAGFVGGPLGFPEIDEINKTLTEKEFNWEKIKSNCKYFELYASTNDPYVPLDRVEYLSKKLDGKLIVVQNAGHFNKAAGFLKFPELLNSILKH
jgi:predicted alpha/beta hydrolase family esterase